LGNAERLDFNNQTFDRIIATCVLAHLQNPELALKEWKRVLKPNGVIGIYVPCEPGIALRVFRRIFTLPKTRKLGFEGYVLCNARDHIHSAQNLNTLIEHIFKHSKKRMFARPLPIKTWYFNLFLYFEIKP
jgi:ubiquinone/menaquinone biosynthesis C-methylase UbiE